MARRTYDFTLDCPLQPRDVFAGLTDFSEKRLRYFANLSRGKFEVLELTDHGARVVEGTGPFVSTEQYEWSTENRLWSVIEESTVAAPGGITDIRIMERPGGCRVIFHIERDFLPGPGRVMLLSVTLNGGKRFFRRTYLRVLKAIMKEKRRTA